VTTKQKIGYHSVVSTQQTQTKPYSSEYLLGTGPVPATVEPRFRENEHPEPSIPRGWPERGRSLVGGAGGPRVIDFCNVVKVWSFSVTRNSVASDAPLVYFLRGAASGCRLHTTHQLPPPLFSSSPS